MNPHHNSNQNPASTPAVQQQANSVVNPQIFNGNVGGLFPNNMPVAAQPCFMNFPGQAFPFQNINGHFPNGINGFIPQQSQFNPSQQQQNQFFAHNSMNPTAFHQNVGLQGQQVLLQNTIQNICQLLQLQNPNYTQCLPANIPMFQNQMVNVTNPQNPGFSVNQQFGTPSSKGPVQHANNGSQNMGQQVQGNLFLPGASGPVVQMQQQHATLTNFQNQIPQGMGPQNHNMFTNQMFAMANLNNTMQNVNQGQPGIVSPMMDANASRQIINTGETHNSSPTLTNLEKNVPTNVNGRWIESQHKNFTGHKTYDASHKGSKSHKHVKEKFGIYKGNMSKDGDNNLAADSVSQNSTKFEKKIPTLTYTDQEIKEWCEARKRNHPANGAVLKKYKKENKPSDNVTNQEAMLRRQQLKEILDKQAELGCEVADIPASYLSGFDKQNPKHDRQQQNKRGKFQNKRKTSFQDRMAKRAKRPRDQKANDYKPKREPSLLHKLLSEDIKRDKNHLLQVFRFITANSFFNEEALRFPSVIVRETNDADEKITCSVVKAEEEEEGEIID
ncbi:hypothetical protein SSX86_007089 [Deinandra increscens subsp. villosa]|uniref:FMR1-interacting protein 1 conserved domain-containing protein n=1 Tax=Deinandra increscens subsp. villosa TaxID=3103831 RepID=A0AAP0H760_9ASTR